MKEDLNEIENQINKIGNVFRISDMLKAAVQVKQPNDIIKTFKIFEAYDNRKIDIIHIKNGIE